jgi:hypothetical protein
MNYPTLLTSAPINLCLYSYLSHPIGQVPSPGEAASDAPAGSLAPLAAMRGCQFSDLFFNLD